MNGMIEKVPIKIEVNGLAPNEFALRVEKAFLASNEEIKEDLTKIARSENKIQIFANAKNAEAILKALKNEGLIAS